jgi:hypothetical protein
MIRGDDADSVISGLLESLILESASALDETASDSVCLVSGFSI